MLLALVVSIVAEGAKPVTPFAGTEVAAMTPEPVAARLAPGPISIAALVFVPPAKLEKLPLAAEIALRTDCSVGMLLSEPGAPTVVTTLRPTDKAVPVALAYCGILPMLVDAGTVMSLPVPLPEPPPTSIVQVLAGAQV